MTTDWVLGGIRLLIACSLKSLLYLPELVSLTATSLRLKMKNRLDIYHDRGGCSLLEYLKETEKTSIS